MGADLAAFQQWMQRSLLACSSQTLDDVAQQVVELLRVRPMRERRLLGAPHLGSGYE
jgi:hypothetical protein